MVRVARLSLSGWGRWPRHECLTYRPERWREQVTVATGVTDQLALASCTSGIGGV